MKPERSIIVRLYASLLCYPRLVIALVAGLVLPFVIQLPSITTYPDTDAFLPPDSPALVLRKQVNSTFEIGDPLLIMVENTDKSGVFTIETLNLIAYLSEKITHLEGVKEDKVSSIFIEDNIEGTEDSIRFERFYDAAVEAEEVAKNIELAVKRCRLYQDRLVSNSGQAALIIAELEDDCSSTQLYRNVGKLIAAAPIQNEQVYLAGEKAVNAVLGTSIQTDMKRLNILCAIVITIVLFFSYQTVRGIGLPLIIVGSAVGFTLGMMAWLGEPIYVITNALPVILLSIGIADAVHILGQYYEETILKPEVGVRELVCRTMHKMWLPVAVTSVTDIAGFLGVYLASSMPPMKAFGLFAAVGVFMAWMLSMLVLPSLLVLMPITRSRAFIKTSALNRVLGTDVFGNMMRKAVGLGLRFPQTVLIVTVALFIVVVFGILKVEVNEERIANFRKDDPIYVANKKINQTFNGIHYLDVFVSTNEPEALFQEDHVERMKKLEAFFSVQPQVGGVLSYLDFLRQMNQAMYENQNSYYQVPEDEATIGQYFLLQSSSSNPENLSSLIDYDYKQAAMRVKLTSGKYTEEKALIEKAEAFINQEIQAADFQVALSGRVDVDYHWIYQLGNNHAKSVGIALLAVWSALILCFRSVRMATFTILPVLCSVCAIYAIMGYTGKWLNVGTSMFAAIAIGTGVDFSVRTMSRLREFYQENDSLKDSQIQLMLATTGRALLFNFMAVFLGFSLLMTSEVPPLVSFGLLVTSCIGVSFLSSLILLPALLQLVGPWFFGLINRV